MRLGWKVLVPISLVWILLLATIDIIRSPDTTHKNWWMVGLGVVFGVVIMLVAAPPGAAKRAAAAEAKREEIEPIDADAFPVPDLAALNARVTPVQVGMTPYYKVYEKRLGTESLTPPAAGEKHPAALGEPEREALDV
jgi:hypothetical protein